MQLRIFVLVIVISCYGFLHAQEGIVKGKITDKDTKGALAGVSIYMDTKGISTSNIDGTYQIKIPAGKHTIRFTYISYTPYTDTIEIKSGETLTLDIPMEASTTELGVTVISAGKYEQKLEDVTVSMEVMKSGFLHNKNTTSVENVMGQCPGVNMLGGQANIRGGSGFSYGAGSRVMVLVDDLPLLTSDAGDVKWSFVPVENISQVEVIKGASSVLYGSSALNGVINFRTAYPKDTAQTDITVSQGIYDKPRRKDLVWWKNRNPKFNMISFLHTNRLGNLDLVLGGNTFTDDGYRKLENERRNRFNFGTNYHFQKIPGLSIGLNGNFMDTKGGLFVLWQNADSAYYPHGGKVSDYHTLRTTLDPFITYITPQGNKHSLRTRYYQTENRNNTNQESVSDVWYAEYQYHIHLKKDLNITSGIVNNYSEVHSAVLYGNHFSTNVGLYAQADKKFNKLLLSLGIRGEYFKVDNTQTKYFVILTKDTTVLPIHPVCRTGINYRLFSHTHLRASFGQGYRFPSVAEKFIQTTVSGLIIYPNPDIHPETGWSAELGAKQAFQLGGLKGYLDVAGFMQEYKNMMQFTFGYWVPPGTPNPNDPITKLRYFGAKSINVGRARITGVELTITAEGNIGKTYFTVLGGYTYIKPIDLDYNPATSGGTYNGNILKYRYEHTAKMDVQAEYKKWSTGISIRYNSFMKNIDASFQNELLNDLLPNLHTKMYILPGLKEYREQHNQGDVVLDYRLAYKLSKGIKISALIKNIFNREYMGRPGDVQPPRNFALMLNARI